MVLWLGSSFVFMLTASLLTIGGVLSLVVTAKLLLVVFATLTIASMVFGPRPVV